MNERKDWIVRVYDVEGDVIKFWVIEDRTEHEAFKEAEADLPSDCYDWSLNPNTEIYGIES
jgi:hypothetical protein